MKINKASGLTQYLTNIYQMRFLSDEKLFIIYSNTKMEFNGKDCQATIGLVSKSVL